MFPEVKIRFFSIYGLDEDGVMPMLELVISSEGSII